MRIIDLDQRSPILGIEGKWSEMTYVAKRFLSIPMNVAGVGSRYDMKELLTKARKDACHYCCEGDEATSRILVAAGKSAALSFCPWRFRKGCGRRVWNPRPTAWRI